MYLLWRITLATVDMSISSIIKVGRIQLFIAIKTGQTRFVIQVAFGHNFFSLINHSMTFGACFKTSLWTFDCCSFQRWGVGSVLKMVHVTGFAKNFILFLEEYVCSIIKIFEKISSFETNYLIVHIVAVVHQTVADFTSKTQFMVTSRIGSNFFSL